MTGASHGDPSDPRQEALRLATDRAWSDAARRVAPLLAGMHGVVVVGVETRAVATVALAIARQLSDPGRSDARRVAIGDLLGEAEPLQSLVEGDDPHGIVDSFLYGVSLNAIARPSIDGGNYFILPSGSEPVLQEEIFTSERWRRLASGFREVGAFLLLAAHSDAPGVSTLCENMGGAVVVGTDAILDPGVHTIATVVPDRRRAREEAEREVAGVRRPTGDQSVVDRLAATTPAAGGLFDADAGADLEGRDLVVVRPGEGGGHRRTPPPPRAVDPRAARAKGGDAKGTSRRVALGVALLAALGVAGWMVSTDPELRSSLGLDALVPAAVEPEPAAKPEGPTVEAQPSAPVPTDSLPLLAPGNPDDSTGASGYAVELITANTPSGAMLHLREKESLLPAATVSPVVFGEGARWYKVVAGAYPSRAQADSLLGALRRAAILSEGAGKIVRAPLAFALRTGLRPAELGAARLEFQRKGLAPYALRDDDGTLTLYVGAFETPEQASLLIKSLQESGVEPVLVYRTGGVF